MGESTSDFKLQLPGGLRVNGVDVIVKHWHLTPDILKTRLGNGDDKIRVMSVAKIAKQKDDEAVKRTLREGQKHAVIGYLKQAPTTKIGGNGRAYCSFTLWDLRDTELRFFFYDDENVAAAVKLAARTLYAILSPRLKPSSPSFDTRALDVTCVGDVMPIGALDGVAACRGTSKDGRQCKLMVHIPSIGEYCKHHVGQASSASRLSSRKSSFSASSVSSTSAFCSADDRRSTGLSCAVKGLARPQDSKASARAAAARLLQGGSTRTGTHAGAAGTASLAAAMDINAAAGRLIGARRGDSGTPATQTLRPATPSPTCPPSTGIAGLSELRRKVDDARARPSSFPPLTSAMPVPSRPAEGAPSFGAGVKSANSSSSFPSRSSSFPSRPLSLTASIPAAASLSSTPRASDRPASAGAQSATSISKLPAGTARPAASGAVIQPASSGGPQRPAVPTTAAIAGAAALSQMSRPVRTAYERLHFLLQSQDSEDFIPAARAVLEVFAAPGVPLSLEEIQVTGIIKLCMKLFTHRDESVALAALRVYRRVKRILAIPKFTTAAQAAAAVPESSPPVGGGEAPLSQAPQAKRPKRTRGDPYGTGGLRSTSAGAKVALLKSIVANSTGTTLDKVIEQEDRKAEQERIQALERLDATEEYKQTITSSLIDALYCETVSQN
eukprot:GHVT01028382.1.p1 GENE.GHVT01028382.1~~GHVT01028382.1.p1  ORF type:complete len:669 (+),score=106.58 GHVT01028382.1:388-2394(+)